MALITFDGDNDERVTASQLTRLGLGSNFPQQSNSAHG